MTNADYLRSLSDENLAKWITLFVKETFSANGLDDEFEMDFDFAVELLGWLKRSKDGE